MTASISLEQRDRLLPSLQHVASMVRDNDRPSRQDLELLLMGSDEQDDATLDELERWARILASVRGSTDPAQRQAAQSALMLRGIPEAPAMLAIGVVTEPLAPSKLKANVEQLDLGTLQAGATGSGEFQVEGGPGQITAESDQIQVTPTTFGAEPTPVRVEVRPGGTAVFWSNLRLATPDETLMVPVLAQWEEEVQVAAAYAQPAVTAPPPVPARVAATENSAWNSAPAASNSWSTPSTPSLPPSPSPFTPAASGMSSAAVMMPPSSAVTDGDYAGFGQRFWAALIDGVIVFIAYLILRALFGSFGVILSLAGGWVYYAAFESSARMATPGKRAMGIVVTDLYGERISFGKATGRYFGKFVSAVIIYIGYIMAAFTEKHQALHDMMAGTLVYKSR